MTETKFIYQNETRWKQLEAFNKTLLRKGIKTLSPIEIKAFAEAFRDVGYHLAYAKTHFPNGTSVPYLSHIVGVAHNYYYIREAHSLQMVKGYFTTKFPAAVRDVRQYFSASAILFLLGFLLAYIYVFADVRNFSQIFPFEFGGVGSGEVIWDYPLMSAVIMTNNIRVAIMALAFGITAGIGTVWILFYNGAIVGALASYVAATGNFNDVIIFWSLILPHGVPELAAIFLSGACGLMIGRAMLVPREHTRKDAVILEARRAVTLMPGIAVMLILSALIEGFFTPLNISYFFKLGFAFLVLVSLSLYFSRR